MQISELFGLLELEFTQSVAWLSYLVVPKVSTLGLSQRWLKPDFQTPRLRPRYCSRIFWFESGYDFFRIWESVSCSNYGIHRWDRNSAISVLTQWDLQRPRRLQLLPKIKSDSGSRSVFSQIFDSRSGPRKNAEFFRSWLQNSWSVANSDLSRLLAYCAIRELSIYFVYLAILRRI